MLSAPATERVALYRSYNYPALCLLQVDPRAVIKKTLGSIIPWCAAVFFIG